MHRLAFLMAAGIALGLSGMSPADAAPRHKHKVRAAPAVAHGIAQPVVATARPGLRRSNALPTKDMVGLRLATLAMGDKSRLLACT